MTNRAMPATSHILLAATLIGGLLAGFSLDRSVVHNPAWHQLGATAWAAYSQHADLSVRGALLYPFLGIGEALLSVVAAMSARRSSSQPRAAALPLYAGALFAVVGLSMTILAAPNMLSVPRLVHDPSGLQRALDGFVFWGNVRSALQILAYFANLWALVAVMSRVETDP